MRYLIALLCPPLAILICGRPFLALFSILLCPFYFPAALLAILIVSARNADKRNLMLINAMENSSEAVAQAMDRQARTIRASASRPKALPEPDDDFEDEPSGPWISISWDGIKTAASNTKHGAIFAYQSLPEWAQPITWGLAAGTPLSLALVVFMMRR